MNGYSQAYIRNRFTKKRGQAAFLLSLAVIITTLCYNVYPYITPDGINKTAFYGLFRLNGAGNKLSDFTGISEDGDIPFAETLYDALAKESEAVPDKYSIVRLDLSKNRDLTLTNQTGYDPDTAALLSAPYPIEHGRTVKLSASSSPLVLVLHTHGTESYSPDGAVEYDSSTSFRSSDTSLNIVSVGAALTDTLINNGIKTVHCEIMHDLESYNDAYAKASQTIQEYLRQYPSIQYVFDIHRDAIIRSDNTSVATDAVIGDGRAAQVMAVIGTNEGGADHPGWEDNLNIALKLQNMLNEQYPGLARPINLRSASFNEQYTKGSMILEIGSCGNSLEEAVRSAKCLGGVIASLILAN